MNSFGPLSWFRSGVRRTGTLLEIRALVKLLPRVKGNGPCWMLCERDVEKEWEPVDGICSSDYNLARVAKEHF